MSIDEIKNIHKSRSDGDDSFFFDSTAQARQRRADTMLINLCELKLELWGTKCDEV
jgi:hypothetical protein